MEFCLFISPDLAVVLTDNTVSCYRIEPGTIAGIICADVLLTLIIVIVTYRCASFRRQRIDNADKVYMNVRANCKS
ncbi:hematopoietic cell signal transducer-like protein [Lates japonicus]|uniref:Hematopoietic cell signal transducer n=1 Tax=Lates japonicus TaxID=270547 RepID=A0AAD3N0E7_LATJO|nr:hematopoietic cell signal transducer-like protein [Lates japonicus]